MATANDVDADLITCGVCLNEYHEEAEISTLFPHHCLPCLLEIFKDGAISCPLCRNISKYENSELVEKLQTNFHALRILELNKRITSYELKQCWCFTCGFKAQAGCPTSKHSVLNLAVDTIENLDGFFKLREEFHVMKNKEKRNLNAVLQKTNEIQMNLDFYSEAVKAAKEELFEFQDENNFLKAETLSKLESLETLQQVATADFQNELSQTTESFLAEATSHLNNSNSEEMVACMKDKWNKSLKKSEKLLDTMTAIASHYERLKKMRITFKIFDENNQPIPTCPLLENGFTLSNEDDPLILQNKAFLSHAVFSLIWKNQNIMIKE